MVKNYEWYPDDPRPMEERSEDEVMYPRGRPERLRWWERLLGWLRGSRES